MELFGFGDVMVMEDLELMMVITRSTPVTTFAGGNNWKQVSGGKVTQ
jgi:hypothetical protein